MAQRVEALATTSDDLSSTPETCMMKGENDCLKFSSDLCTLAIAEALNMRVHISACARTHTSSVATIT